MDKEKNNPLKRNRWCIATSIVTALVAIHTLTFLILVWLVWELHVIVGWDKVRINPMSLIEITILMTCAIGVWCQRSSFLIALLIYHLFDVFSRFYMITQGGANPIGLIFPLAQILLCIKTFYSLRETKRLKIIDIKAYEN
jgi:uncharacterized membrane protein